MAPFRYKFCIFLLGIFGCVALWFSHNLISVHYSLKAPSWLSERLAERRQILRQHCAMKPPDPNFIKNADFTRFIVIEELRLVFCFIPKISCTTWKRVLYEAKNNGTKLRGIPHNKQHFSWLKDYLPAERKAILDTYYKAMFVREPFGRLLSAFKNKVESRRLLDARLEAFATNVTSKEMEKYKFLHFVRYILSFNRSLLTMNQHWRSYEQICPCEVEYDFIGHFENLDEEAPHFLRAIGVDHYVTFPKYHPSRSKPYLLEYYSQLDKEEIFKLAKFYELDFKLFGYDFPGPLKEIWTKNMAHEEVYTQIAL